MRRVVFCLAVVVGQLAYAASPFGTLEHGIERAFFGLVTVGTWWLIEWTTGEGRP